MPTFYANTIFLPRELRGESATGETCHHGRALSGEGCPACGAEAGEFPIVFGQTIVREFTPLSDAEVSEVVYGYVTAATWTNLDKPCTECGGTGIDPSTVEELESDRRECPECEGSGGSDQTGSDPYEYGPDDLDSESSARVREIVAGFLGAPGHWSFATTADVRLYEEWHGSMIDHPQAVGGRQLGARECSALECLGHTLYMTAIGSGCSFTDDEWSERDDMPSERREYNGLLRRLEHAASGHGLHSVMLCNDGSIQVQG